MRFLWKKHRANRSTCLPWNNNRITPRIRINSRCSRYYNLSTFTASSTLQIFDTLSGTRKPLQSSSSSSLLLPSSTSSSFSSPQPYISWYTCGPTVYDAAHLGHARTYVALDIARRLTSVFTNATTPILYAINITDVDDKIIARAKEKKMHPLDLARHFEEDFFADMKNLGVLPPTVAPRVSEHIPEIIDYIRVLVEHRKCAYLGSDGVYMDTQALGEGGYGKLAPSSKAIITGGGGGGGGEGERSASARDTMDNLRGKKNPRDFALWKFASAERDSFILDPTSSSSSIWAWDSPWGKGRPGWHIECSAMINTIFGNPNGTGSSAYVDIHAGGIDLAFPHHCNEIAQAEAFLGTLGPTFSSSGPSTSSVSVSEAKCQGAMNSPITSRPWVNTWMHTGHLHINGAKMSKSLKNFITIQDMLSLKESGSSVGSENNNNVTASLTMPPGVDASDAFRMFVAQHHYRTNITYSHALLMEAANAVRRINTVMEDSIRAITAQYHGVMKSSSSSSQPTRKWTSNEFDLLHRINSLSNQVQAHCANDFDTSSACKLLLQQGLEIFTRYLIVTQHKPNIQTLLFALEQYNSFFSIFGFTFAIQRGKVLREISYSWSAGSSSGRRKREEEEGGVGGISVVAQDCGGSEKKNNNDNTTTTHHLLSEEPASGQPPSVRALIEFRGQIRNIGGELGKELKRVEKKALTSVEEMEKGDEESEKKKVTTQQPNMLPQLREKVTEILKACDHVRDQVLPGLGYEVKDTPTGPALTFVGKKKM